MNKRRLFMNASVRKLFVYACLSEKLSKQQTTYRKAPRAFHMAYKTQGQQCGRSFAVGTLTAVFVVGGSGLSLIREWPFTPALPHKQHGELHHQCRQKTGRNAFYPGTTWGSGEGSESLVSSPEPMVLTRRTELGSGTDSAWRTTHRLSWLPATVPSRAACFPSHTISHNFPGFLRCHISIFCSVLFCSKFCYTELLLWYNRIS